MGTPQATHTQNTICKERNERGVGLMSDKVKRKCVLVTIRQTFSTFEKGTKV